MPDKILVLSGMAFKGRPKISDLRGSSSVNIARKLYSAAYSLRLHDFTAYTNELKNLQVGEVFENLSDACEGAAALIVLNNHRGYEEFYLPKNLPNNFAVLDIWQVCKKIQAENFAEYYTIGNLLISEV